MRGKQRVSHTCFSDANVLTLAQDDPVKENEPAKFHYYCTFLVFDGPPSSELEIEIQVCEDPQDEGARVSFVDKHDPFS